MVFLDDEKGKGLFEKLAPGLRPSSKQAMRLDSRISPFLLIVK
jgi:hypothetical protein